MARKRARKNKRQSSRRKSGISLINLAETVALTNAVTQTAFNTDVYNFVMGGDGLGGNTVAGASVISLKELFNPEQSASVRTMQTGRVGSSYSQMKVGNTYSLVAQNVRDNWMSGAAQMVLIPIGFKFGRKLAAPAVNKINALLRKAGVASLVKV